MAHTKPQSRKSSGPTTWEIVLKILGIQAFLVTAGIGIWLAGHYADRTSVWDRAAHPGSAAQTPSARRAFSLPIALKDFAVPAPGDADRHAPIAQSDFSRAFSRLDRALRAHASQQPDRLLAEANKKAGACPIFWNDGEPSLALSESNSHGLDLSAALNRCADAVEKLR